MNVSDAIKHAKALTGSVVDDSVLCRWLSELDGRLVFEFFHGDAWTAYSLPEDENTELLVAFPWDGLYVHYLEAMTYYSNGEYDRSKNAQAMADKLEDDWRKWLTRTHLPLSMDVLKRCAAGIEIPNSLSVLTVGERARLWYYLSAYAIAVKHGYVGTEEEWLESLRGEPGAAFTYDMFTAEQLAALRGPAGTSPTVKVVKEDGAAIITFTTAAGDTVFKVNDGGDGTGIETIALKESTVAGNTYTVALSDGTSYEITAPVGPKGDAFRYEDFTEEQLAALKGGKGDAFEYEDFTAEQLEALRGPAGSSIQSITRTAGTGASGTTDTYTITLTDGSTATFQVYNGKDGMGAGDFMASGAVPMTGNLRMGGNKVTGMADGTEDTDGATVGQLKGKQDALAGAEGQVVGFDADGKPIAQNAPSGLPEGTEGQIVGYNADGNAQAVDSPYQKAVGLGYAGTEAEFYAALVTLKDGPFLPLSGGTVTGNVHFGTSGQGTIGLFLDNGELFLGPTDTYPSIYMKNFDDGKKGIQFDCVDRGEVIFSDMRLTYVGTPQNNTDAATKGYVDGLIGTISTMLDSINGEVA